jgi:hypothetical protein
MSDIDDMDDDTLHEIALYTDPCDAGAGCVPSIIVSGVTDWELLEGNILMADTQDGDRRIFNLAHYSRVDIVEDKSSEWCFLEEFNDSDWPEVTGE